MKKVMFMVLLFAALTAQAQGNEERETINVEAAAGYNWLTNSNITPFGIHYRDNYKGGFSGSVSVNYLFADDWGVGIHYSALGTEGNFDLDASNKVSENIDVNYIAPQIRLVDARRGRWGYAASLGVGYLWYKNNGWMNETDYEVTAHACGVHGSILVSYRVMPHMDVFANLNSFDALKMKDVECTAQGGTQIILLNQADPYKLKFRSVGVQLGVRAVF